MKAFVPFRYTKALCRRPAKSIRELGLKMFPGKNESKMDYNLCLEQHTAYVEALKKSGVNVTVLNTEEENPDCVFVEDTAVIINKTVLITNPGASTRKTEVHSIRNFFEENEPEMKVVSMKQPACAEGGDVMFTGSEIFVGLSERTNELGVEAIRRAFPEYPVHAVTVGADTLHLKSMMGVPKPGWLSVGTSRSADNALKEIIDRGKTKYNVLRAVGDFSASCIAANDTLIHRCAEEYPESYEAYQQMRHKQKFDLNFSELEKVDGSLTCCSLLY